MGNRGHGTEAQRSRVVALADLKGCGLGCLVFIAAVVGAALVPQLEGLLLTIAAFVFVALVHLLRKRTGGDDREDPPST